jgi:hypothetical protein
MKSKAVIFGDGTDLKIVFGKAVKVIPIAELYKEESNSFLEKLFNNFSVYVVKQVVPTTKEDVLSEIGKMSAPDVASRQPVESQQLPPPPQPQKPASFANMTPPGAPASADVDGTEWVQWTGESTIIIDDILTKERIPNPFNPGQMEKKSLVLAPNQAICLGDLDAEQVRKSRTLKALMGSGRLVCLTEAQASQAQASFFEDMARQQEENDKRLDQWAPIVDNHEAVLEGTSSTIHGHDAEPMEVTMEGEAEESMPNEGMTMASLMSLIGEQHAAESETEVVELADLPGENQEVREARAASRDHLRPEAKAQGKAIKRSSE